MSCGCSQSNMSGGGKKTLSNLTVSELRKIATRINLEGRSKITKKEDLIKAIQISNKKNLKTY